VGIQVLVGLGIREVSVTPVAIATVKEALAAVDSTKTAELSRKALEAPGATEVEKLFRSRP
jgi:phosphocarrier protein FPr